MLSGVESNLSLLNQCAAIFHTGVYQDGCGDTPFFDPGDFAEVGDWLSAGGRMYLMGDNKNCMSETKKDLLNDFLSAIGSSIQFHNDKDCRYGCDDPQVTVPASIGSVSGDFVYDRGGRVSGGTTLATAPSGVAGKPDCDGHIFMAGESIGSGYIVVVSDIESTVDSCDPAPLDNCWFIRELIEGNL